MYEQINRCFNDVKEWMLTSKPKLNTDKTVGQRDRLKAYFSHDILVVLSAWLSQSGTGTCGFRLIFTCRNMFRVSGKMFYVTLGLQAGEAVS